MKAQTSLLTILFFTLAINSMAQIPNPSFETWDNNHPFGWHYYPESPYNFVTQDSNAYEGVFAVRSTILQTGPVVNYAGLITGLFDPTNPTFVSSNGFIPINTKPQKLYGWYILQNNNVDTFTVMIDFKKDGNIIGSGDFATVNETASYTQFEVDINYSSIEVPDSFQILISFNHQMYQANVGNVGAYYIVDSLTFDLTSSIDEVTKNNNDLKVYPNPTNDQLIFQMLNAKSIEKIEIYTISGSLIKRSEPHNFYQNEVVREYDSGMYLYKIWIGEEIIDGRFIKR